MTYIEGSTAPLHQHQSFGQIYVYPRFLQIFQQFNDQSVRKHSHCIFSGFTLLQDDSSSTIADVRIHLIGLVVLLECLGFLSLMYSLRFVFIFALSVLSLNMWLKQGPRYLVLVHKIWYRSHILRFRIELNGSWHPKISILDSLLKDCQAQLRLSHMILRANQIRLFNPSKPKSHESIILPFDWSVISSTLSSQLEVLSFTMYIFQILQIDAF